MSNLYYLEIDASGFEAPCDEGQWLGYGLIVAEGDSLEECLETAYVDLIDQDGGEFALREADSNEMQDAIEYEFLKKYGKSACRTRSDAQELEREQRGRDAEVVASLRKGDL